MSGEHDAPAPVAPTKAQYEALAAFRHAIRRYLSFAQGAAEGSGITMQQHQALLAIKASREESLSIGELAEQLLLKHHSAVELTDRLVRAGLVERRRHPDDARRAIVSLSDKGEQTLSSLAWAHLRELDERGPEFARTMKRLMAIHAKAR